MASNDPTDTGGLFIGRRPGTAPLRYRGTPARAGAPRRRADGLLSALLLLLELAVCLTLWGPQPLGWLSVGIATAFAGMVLTLFITLALARRIDHAWKLVRRAAGHEQHRGALEWIFVISAGIAAIVFTFWFLVIAGPGPQIAPRF
jgi:hypothetical protein